MAGDLVIRKRKQVGLSVIGIGVYACVCMHARGCVCVCMRACVCACMHVCVQACVCVCASMRVCVPKIIM